MSSPIWVLYSIDLTYPGVSDMHRTCTCPIKGELSSHPIVFISSPLLPPCLSCDKCASTTHTTPSAPVFFHLLLPWRQSDSRRKGARFRSNPIASTPTWSDHVTPPSTRSTTCSAVVVPASQDLILFLTLPLFPSKQFTHSETPHPRRSITPDYLRRRIFPLADSCWLECTLRWSVNTTGGCQSVSCPSHVKGTDSASPFWTST